MSRDFPSLDARRAAPPLDRARLESLALRYVGRYATTRGKLGDYLRRKLTARGWADEGDAPVDAIVERLAALGYVDDAAFAVARGASLGRRGYGVRRVAQALRAAGIEDADSAVARGAAADDALAAALAFARRKRIGPYAETIADIDQRRRQFGAMLRAGHDMTLARRIVAAAPGDAIEGD